MSEAKQAWLSRYKSRAGKAIARRSWEAAEAALSERDSALRKILSRETSGPFPEDDHVQKSENITDALALLGPEA